MGNVSIISVIFFELLDELDGRRLTDGGKSSSNPVMVLNFLLDKRPWLVLGVYLTCLASLVMINPCTGC